MQRLGLLVQRLALVLLLLGALGMIASMLLGVADVVGTDLFSQPVPGVREITESTMVLIVFGALAFTQARRGHIRVEILTMHLGPRTRSLLDALAHLVAIAYFALLCWQGWNELIYSLEIGEATQGSIRIPLYPARFFLVAGTGLLLLQLVLDVAADLDRARRGEGPPESPTPAGPSVSSQDAPGQSTATVKSAATSAAAAIVLPGFR